MNQVRNTQTIVNRTGLQHFSHMGNNPNSLTIDSRNTLASKASNRTFKGSGSISYIHVGLIPRYIKLLVWLLDPADPGPYFIMGERITRLHRLSGSSYTVKYLKEATRILQHYMAGNLVHSSQDAGLGISGGIPKLIPGSLRLLIRQRDPVTVRCVLTVLGLFRIMRTTSKVKLETITGEFTGLSTTLPDYELRKSINKISSR